MKIRDAEIDFDVKFEYRWNGFNAYNRIFFKENFPADYISENKLEVVASAMKNSEFFLSQFNEFNGINLTLDSDIIELKDLVRNVEYICQEDGDGHNMIILRIYTSNGPIVFDAGFKGHVLDEDRMIYRITDVGI